MSELSQIALTFLNTPYQGGTLDENPQEQLVVRTDVFDCLTLIETCIATKYAQKTNKSIAEALEYIRYRNGKRGDYSSRLHYALDWIHDNEQKGIIKNITATLNGIETKKEINFMSSHTECYPRMTDTQKEKIIRIEKMLSDRSFNVIPVDCIKQISPKIKEGDIIFFASSTSGLDTAHVGIAHKTQTDTTFIHASSLKKKVIINDSSLIDYCQEMKNIYGIIVCRLV